MYWISHYLQKGFYLDYLLNLNYTEKRFFILSMEKHKTEQIKYDYDKMEVFFKAFGGGN